MAVCAYEVRRIRGSGPDVVTVFVVIFVLQCCLPGVVLFASLPFVDPMHPTGTGAFDRILSRVDVATGLLVLGLTAWFAFFFYAFTALTGNLLRRLGMQWPAATRFVVSGAPARLLCVIALGAVLTSVSFWLIGDTMFERYANLILFRQYSEDVDRTLLSNYAFSLTQSWAWLSVPALFVIYESRGRSLSWYLCLGCAIVFAVLGVSRRSLFIPMLLAYLALVLFDGRWRLKWVLFLSLPVLLWVGFGKEFFSATASGVSLDEVSGRYSSVASALVRTACDIGITLMESLGTVNLLDLDARFGVDHLLSLLRRIPVSWFGYDAGLPERIVRISTEAFASADDQDIPPDCSARCGWTSASLVRLCGPSCWLYRSPSCSGCSHGRSLPDRPRRRSLWRFSWSRCH